MKTPERVPRADVRRFGLSAVVAAVAGVILGTALAAIGGNAVQNGPVAHAAPADIFDEADRAVIEAEFDMALVHAGTAAPYTGNGPVGINLLVKSNTSVVDWTVVGWANMTTPPAIRICSEDYVHFSAHDWVWQDSSSAGGAFVGIPTTVPGRLGPSGDQCALQIRSVGVWTILICVEGKRGGAQGIYDAPDGRHVDRWDRCLSKEAVV